IFFGVVFFVLLLIAALTSNVALMEVGVGYLMDRHKFHRPKATVIISILTLVISIPCALSMGILSDTAVLGFLAKGPFASLHLFALNAFDFVDYIAQNVFMIVAGLFTCIFIGYYWTVDNVIKEITNDGEIPFRGAGILRFLLRYVSPLVIFIVLLRALNIFDLIGGWL
ncbi:MAG: hypothetical protein LUG50_15040, partial [Planctomycetaceae bacterium]|nr:hypothetical protein [Planctomycetaceae bacterium]